MWRGIPDRIHLVRMARPILHEFAEAVGDRIVIHESVVDVAALNPGNFNTWPELELAVGGYDWSAWTWLGWSLVLMWKQRPGEGRLYVKSKRTRMGSI